MAKKKDSSASPFVPAEEQPYRVPDNWCWTRLGNLCTDIQYGYTAKAILDNNCPKMLRITDIQEGGVDWNNVPNCNIGETDFEKYELLSNDIVFARTGATTGKSYLVFEPPKAVYASYLIRIRLNSFLDKKYVFYMLQSDVYWKQITELSSGIAQPGVNAAKLQSLMFPLPPVIEQHRIVSRIESLFSKLDEATEKAQAVVDGFELRKSAILHKAFTGELTARWRKEHGVGLESWKDKTVGKVCEDVKVGIVIKPSQYYTNKEDGTPAFRSANVRELYIEDSDWVYLNSVGMEQNRRSIVHVGDVLVVRSGNPGTSCVVTKEFDGYNAIDILIAVPNRSQITPHFLCAYTNSPFGKSLVAENKRGMALMHFNVKGYSNLPIKVPSLPEQEVCIQALTNLLNREQQAKDAAEAVLDQIDTMKKAILARAFRGELGTNDPKEEWAGELVKKLLC